VLTPHASAIVFWIRNGGWKPPRSVARTAAYCWPYEESGYDNTKPGRLPDLLPHLSAKRIVEMGANAVKVLIY